MIDAVRRPNFWVVIVATSASVLCGTAAKADGNGGRSPQLPASWPQPHFLEG